MNSVLDGKGATGNRQRSLPADSTYTPVNFSPKSHCKWLNHPSFPDNVLAASMISFVYISSDLWPRSFRPPPPAVFMEGSFHLSSTLGSKNFRQPKEDLPSPRDLSMTSFQFSLLPPASAPPQSHPHSQNFIAYVEGHEQPHN